MLLLRLSVPLLCFLAPFLDDELLKEFKRYFKKYTDSPTRVEAILSLEDCADRGVPEALLPILKDEDDEARRAAVSVLGKLRAPSQVNSLLAELQTESNPEIRVGLLRAIALGAYPSAAPLLQPLLLDKDWRVRQEAIAALVSVSPDAAGDPILLLCEDPEALVRCAAFSALGSLKHAAVVQPAIMQLDSSSWQLRACVIQTLGQVRHRDSIEPLIRRMELEEGRLVVDLGLALDEITGRDFGSNLADWTRFWDRFGDRFEIPSDEELAKTRQARIKGREQYAPSSEASVAFGGVETPSRSILFVIDVSGSMEQEISDRERYEGSDFTEFSRIGIVKTELIRTIQNLSSDVQFNIISFATELKPWKKDLVKASPSNKSSAESFVSRLIAIGGNSKSRLAMAGLVGSASLEAGKTNTHAALMSALGVPLDSKQKISQAGEVDTIFFLSDGRPSTGKYIEVGDILREVKRENEFKKVVIHTLGIGDFEKSFMQQLAQDSGGIFVDLGK